MTDIFKKDFKIEREGGLRVVFNLRLPYMHNNHDGTWSQIFTKECDEADLVKRIEHAASCGRIASLEQEALFALQRAKQAGQPGPK